MLKSFRWAAVAGMLLLALSPAVFAAAAPAAVAAQSYDLGAAVARALSENFTVEAAKADTRGAAEGIKAARGAFGPALGTTYGYQKRQKKYAPGSATERDKDLFSWTVWLRQNVFSGFATLNAYQRSVLEKENAEANLDRARLALIGTVQENFLLLLQARENVRSAKDSLERLRSQMKVTKAFYDVGLRPRLDVLQAEVDVATAENVLLQATNNYETQVARLNTLLVLPVDKQVEYTGDLAYIPFIRGLEQCLAAAYGKRPDLRMAEKSVAIAGKNTNIVKSDLYPRVTAEGGWNSQGDSPAVSGSSNMPQDFSQWSVGVTGEWTAFSWGTTYHSVQQSKQTENRMKAEESNLRQEIAYDISSRLLKISEAAKRIKVAQKGLEQAKEAYRMADARYQAQVGIFIDVLDAQSKLSIAEAALTGAQSDYLIALSMLHVAMGEENPALLPLQ